MSTPAAWAVQQDWTTIPSESIAEGITRQMMWGDRMMICRLTFAPGVVNLMVDLTYTLLDPRIRY